MTFIIKAKKLFDIDHIDVNKILVPKKEHYSKYNSFKYFIGYNDNKFDKNKITMSLMIKDIQFLQLQSN